MGKPRGFRGSLWQLAKVVTTAGSTIAALYLGWGWLASQIVWAGEYRQSQHQVACRLDAFERSNIEGQIVDLKIRISDIQRRRSLSRDDSRDLALLTTRLESLTRRSATLGAGCPN